MRTLPLITKDGVLSKPALAASLALACILLK